ncbi:MAG: NAD(P)H-dependent oxidoreductase subunit E, partial [Dehalococcoidia bacterium]|nr:NAD(P)H-dependent oxidoreductase subunit E [Dehalococcoidia bacterium]
QHEFGYLPDWAMEVVGWHLGIPSSEVYGAATSYTELRIQKPREIVVRVCTALSCLTQGSADILSALEEELDPTSAESQFMLEETPCGFLCGMAPAIEINGRWHGRLDPQSAIQLVRNAAND